MKVSNCSALRTGAQVKPGDDQDEGNEKDERGDGVNFRGDAAAEAAPDFEGQSIVAADEKESDGDFVHGEGEDQQAGGDERKFEVGQSDAPERLQRRSAQIERGFFLGAIHFLEASEKLGGGNGNEGGAVAEEYGEQAEIRAGVHGEH